MTDSIITDEEVKKPKEPVRSQRDQDYEVLIAKREAERNAALPAEEPKDQDPTEKKEPPKEEPTKEIETIVLTGEDGNPIKVPINARYRAKIDGDEVETTFGNIVRSHQIGASADKRMKTVSDKQKELETKERALNARGQELEGKEKAYLEKQNELDAKKESGQLDDAKFEELSKQLLSAMADDEDPEGAMKDVLKKLVPPPQQIDVDKIASDAEKKALAAVEKREREKNEKAESDRQKRIDEARNKANERFAAALDGEFSILKDDPDLMRLAKSYANDEYTSNPDADPWEVISGAVEKVKTFKSRYTAPDDKKPPPTPKSASARASIGEDKKPPTRAEILNDMRKSRGQPSI